MTIIVSYSEIFKWQTCRRQYYYRFTLGLSPLEESDPINLGVKGHKLLQSFFEFLRSGMTKEEARQATLQSAHHMQSNNADFNLLKAWTLVDTHIRETDFTAEAVLIENRFLFPASALDDDPALSDVQIGFTPDIVFERTGGMLDVVDFKFIGRAWSNSKMNRFPQLKLYTAFLRRMGYNISRCKLQFFNTTTGKTSEKNYTLGAEEEAILIRDFMEAVKEVVAFRRKEIAEKSLAARTMNYTACQYCQFEFPCTLEGEGKNATRTLTTQYQKSNYDYTR